MLSFEIESWTWYGIVTTVLLSRTAARIAHFGSPKYLQLDDWLMIVVLAFYTTQIVTLNIVTTTETSLLPPGYLNNHILSPNEISRRVYGSKIALVVEQCQVAEIWLVKACLLTMYYRITYAAFPAQNLLVILLAIYVAITFCVMEILALFVWCRPFRNYWAVPTPNTQCSTATHHLITNAVFNLSSDVAMLAIAIPMFVRSHLPVQRKMALCVVFGLGVFTIASASLNKYYSFTNPFGLLWVYWYLRESSTAILVANLPFLWGLARKGLGLRDDDSFPTYISREKIARTFRHKVSRIAGTYKSTSTATGTTDCDAKTEKVQDSEQQTSDRFGSYDVSNDSRQNSYALHFEPMSPLRVDVLRRPTSIASTQASTMASSRRTPSVVPSSRLEAEIMMDEGMASPNWPFPRRNPEEMLPSVVVKSPHGHLVA